MSDAAQDLLLESLRWLQTSQEYSDLKIFCGEEVFKVHKAIICSRSEYFQTSCRWGKSENPKEEIVLEDDDPRLISLLIDYMYQLDYSDLGIVEVFSEQAGTPVEPESPVTKNVQFFENLGTPGHVEIPPDVPPPSDINLQPEVPDEAHPTEPILDNFMFGQFSKKDKKAKKKKRKSSKPRLKDYDGDLQNDKLTTNVLMYALADKYQIKGLKTLAKEKFQAAVATNWQTQAFAMAAELAFETTPGSDKGLRNVVINTLNEHRELADYEEIQKLLDSGNGMAWAFVKILLGRYDPWE